MTSPGRRAGGPRGARDRVRISHAQTRATLAAVPAFVVAAGVAAVLDERWVALHLFLAGAVATAISAVTLMLAVTWSAAPAPAGGWVAAQRAAVVLGAAGVVVGRRVITSDAVVAAAGAAYAAGLVALGVLLVLTVRRGVERRFDVAVAGYVTAVVAGSVGVALGVHMATTGAATDRAAHLAANLLGFVGITVLVTLPHFAATVGRSRMSPAATQRRLVANLVLPAAAVAVVVVSLVADRRWPAAAGFVAYAAAVAAALSIVPRPSARQLRWAGPRVVALWAGCGWWIAAVLAGAADAAAGRPPLQDRWLGVLVVAGYGQVLWGALAYLVPVLRGGGHERLSRGFALTRSWPGLVAANAAGVLLVMGAPAPVVSLVVALWVVETLARGLVVTADRPSAASSSPSPPPTHPG